MKEKLKELTKDTAVYGISTILSRFLTFILVPFYSQYLIPAEYGIVSTVYAYIAFLNILYLYGMDSAYLKFASLKDELNPKEVFSNGFLFVLSTSIILSVIILSFRSSINYAIEIPEQFSIITIYTTLILFFDALSVIPFAYLRITRKAKKFALLKTLNIVLTVTLNIILIAGYRKGIEAIFFSNLAASIFTILTLSKEVFQNLNLKFDSEILKRMLRFGIPYLPAGLASMVIQVIDRPILQKLTNESVVGVYQMNYRLGIFMMLFVSMFQYAWQPFFLSNAKEKNAKEIFSKVMTYFILAGSLILVLLSIFIDDIVKIEIFGRNFINSNYWDGLPIVPVVLFGYLFNGIYVNLTAGIFIEEKTKYIPYITGFGALANVVANFILIPVYGMMGAAFATLISYFVMALGLYFAARKFYKIDYEYYKITKIFISLGVTAIVFYYFSPMSLLLKTGLLIFFIALLIIFGIINPNEIKSLKNLFRRKAITK